MLFICIVFTLYYIFYKNNLFILIRMSKLKYTILNILVLYQLFIIITILFYNFK